MEELYCKDCIYFRQSLVTSRGATCHNPRAKTSDIDYVFGTVTYSPCSTMRNSENECGAKAQWFQSKYEDHLVCPL